MISTGKQTPWRRAWLPALIWMGFFGWIFDCQGQVTVTRQDDIHVRINADWPMIKYGGYQPIQMTIENRGPDANLQILANKNLDIGQFRAPTVEKNLSLAQNAKVKLTFLIPIVSKSRSHLIHFYKDRKLLDQLTFLYEGSFRFGMVGDSVLAVGGGRPNFNGLHAFSGGTVTTTYDYIDASESPDTWLAYSGIDIVAVHASVFITQPGGTNSFSASQLYQLLRWVRAGGNLIVHDVGILPNQLGSVDEALGLASHESISPGWFGPPSSSVPAMPLPVIPARTAKSADDPGMEKWPLQIRGLMLGQILALKEPLFENDPRRWSSVYQALQENNVHWYKRNGMCTPLANSEFLEFVMSGIQIIPTWGFIVLITFFSIVIGPVNYYLLRRKHKIGQLLWTTPLIALITSLALLSYSSIANGTSTRVRLRSLTLLDQNDQTAVSLTRAAVFSGMTPRGGLRFDPNTAVYPIWQDYGAFQSGHVDWTDAQTLTGSFHTANTRSQFLLLTPRTERGRLQVDAAVSGQLPVTNGLEWNIEMLLVRTADGLNYFGTDLAAGETRKLKRAENDDLVKFEKRLARQKLKAPQTGVRPRFGGYSNARYYFDSQRTISTSFKSGLLERHFAIFSHGLSRNQFDLPLKSYAAVLSEPPKLDLGIARYRTFEELHILLGFY